MLSRSWLVGMLPIGSTIFVNTHEVLSEMFRAMCTSPQAREGAKIPNWAKVFPYVNGGLFSGGVEVPRFSKIA